MKPVLFLDVDDTLLAYPGGQAGPGVPEFVRWAKEHFEVRWLTMWCPEGNISEAVDFRFGGKLLPHLARRMEMPEAELAEIVNPHPFGVSYGGFGGQWRDKSDSVRAMLAETPDRRWAWVEDPFLDVSEKRWLAAPENGAHYYETSVTHRDDAVYRTADLLAQRFELPEMPRAVEV